MGTWLCRVRALQRLLLGQTRAVIAAQAIGPSLRGHAESLHHEHGAAVSRLSECGAHGGARGPVLCEALHQDVEDALRAQALCGAGAGVHDAATERGLLACMQHAEMTPLRMHWQGVLYGTSVFSRWGMSSAPGSLLVAF